MLDGFVSVDEFLKSGRYNTGVILVQADVSKKGSCCLSLELLYRLASMRNYINKGVVDNYMFPQAVVKHAEEINSPIGLMVMEVPHADKEKLRDEKVRQNLRLKEMGLYLARKRDSDTEPYSIITVTHPDYPEYVYFSRTKERTKLPTAIQRIQERFRRMIYELPLQRENSGTLSSFLYGKDEQFIRRFNFSVDEGNTGIVGVRETNKRILMLHQDALKKSLIPLNTIDKRHYDGA